MKKRIWNKSGMKQIINSGWKLFDKQTNVITTGNVYANTQLSSYIRPWKETQCNGITYNEGYLMKYDLQQYWRFLSYVPKRIMNVLKDKERTESIILYMFFTTTNDRIFPFCFVLTDYSHNLIDYSVVRGYKQSYCKRFRAAQEAISYITV